MKRTITGLEKLSQDRSWQSKIKGNIAYLCHAASINQNYEIGIELLQKIFPSRLKAILGPQHGLVCDVQDDMKESQDFHHPFFNLPVYSLYSKTRIPTEKMLDGIDTLIIDLQDVGTRVYTYISTMTLAMEFCGKNNIDVVILDRPNPIGGKIIEGNTLEKSFASFVGRHEIPMRHSLTMGEMAQLALKYFKSDCNLTVIPMDSWKRSMFFDETNLPWVLPSPNLPTFKSALTFPGTVLFEGTNISEGRGTTISLEVIGHPDIEPYSCTQNFLEDIPLEGFILRPIFFQPTFQKHQNTTCGGVQIHVTDKNKFRPWSLGQLLCQKLYHDLKDSFEWKKPPYEYEFEKMPIDLINGCQNLRNWVESNGSFEELNRIEKENHEDFLNKRESILLYK